MRLFAFVVLFLVGCHVEPTDPPDWYGDERFTEAERAEVQRGAEWLYAHAGLPVPRIEWGNGEPAIRRERGPLGADGECSGTTVYIGATENLAGLTAHELAHCQLGFVDGYRTGDAPTDGIMRVLEPMRWTEAETAQCREKSQWCPAGLPSRDP